MEFSHNNIFRGFSGEDVLAFSCKTSDSIENIDISQR